MDTQETESSQKEEAHWGKPFLLRITGISSIVMGATGFLFFGSLIFYLIADQEFAHRFINTYMTRQMFWIYIIIGCMLHLLLLVSGFLLFRLKKAGLWSFLLSSLGLVLFGEIADNNLYLSEIILCLVFFMIILLYRKHLK